MGRAACEEQFTFFGVLGVQLDARFGTIVRIGLFDAMDKAHAFNVVAMGHDQVQDSLGGGVGCIGVAKVVD